MLYRGRYNSGGDKTVASLVVAPSDAAAIAWAGADFTAMGSNDEVTIQRAIDALDATTGGTVFLADGTFTIAEEITISKSNVALVGGANTRIKRATQVRTQLAAEAAAGPTTTITVDSTVGFKPGHIVKLTQADGSVFDTVEVLTVDSATSLTFTGAIARWNEAASLANTYAIDDFVNVNYDMLRIFGTSGTSIENIRIENIYFDGDDPNFTTLDKTAGDVGASGEQQNDYYENGIRVYYCNDITIKGCTFKDITYNAMLIHGGNPVNNIKVLNNNIETSSEQFQSRGIALEAQSDYFLVDGNYFISTRTPDSAADASKGVYFSGHATNPVSGLVTNNHISGWSMGVTSFGDARNVVISQNYIKDTNKYAIEMGTCSHCVITENRCEAQVEGNLVQDAGTRNLWFSNHFVVTTLLGGVQVTATSSEAQFKHNLFYTAGFMNTVINIATSGNEDWIIENNTFSGGQNRELPDLTGTVSPSPCGARNIDSSGGAVTVTWGSGYYAGQRVQITMDEASNASTVSVTNHVTSDPEVYTFNAVDETLIMEWTGTEWITLYATATV